MRRKYLFWKLNENIKIFPGPELTTENHNHHITCINSDNSICRKINDNKKIMKANGNRHNIIITDHEKKNIDCDYTVGIQQ